MLVSRGDIERNREQGKIIIENLRETLDFTYRDIADTIDYGLEKGYFYEKLLSSNGGKQKKILNVGQIPA